MKFDSIVSDLCESGDHLISNYNNVIEAKKYCAAGRAYCHYLNNNRVEAEYMYNAFKEKNDKIFKTAMQLLDLSIDAANLELTDTSLKIVESMKKAYPDFYSAYFRKLFGK